MVLSAKATVPVGRSPAQWLTVIGLVVMLIGSISAGVASAQSSGTIQGVIVDQLGAPMPAMVTLIQDGQSVSATETDATGGFLFCELSTGRYRVEAMAPGFATHLSEPIYVGSGEVNIELALSVGPIAQHVVVTAEAAETTQARVGAPVTVVDRTDLDAIGNPDVLGALRTVPGAQVVQTGQRGGATALFVRGGASDFNKVLIDGVPANDIGGAFDFGGLSAAGVDRVEVLRTANSVQYGADALSGVINVTTPRGHTSTPELSYSIGGGNLGTVRQELSVGGVVDRFDYFFNVSRFDTDNDLPNNAFKNDTFAGRFGVAIGSATDLSVTVRRIASALGLPGAVLFNGLVDDSSQSAELTFVGVTATSQVNDRLQTTVRFASNDQTSRFVNSQPTGEPFDPFGFGANYLGEPVTIAGANGFSASGRAIMDFGGVYPSLFDSDTSRRSVAGQADYRLTDVLDVSGGVRIEHEEGSQDGSFGGSSTQRTNYGGFVEARASFGNRTYLTAGSGLDDNEIFGFAATPRVSAAVYVRQPTPEPRMFGDTKLTFNAGRGIKAPVVFDELNSLFVLLEAAPGGADVITNAGIEPIGPERSRSIDFGVEQGLWNNRARARVAFFHNDFRDLIEFVSNFALPELGVAPSAAFAVPFGATVNASSYRARGIETSGDVAIGDDLRIGGGYMFLDATVNESFSGSALFPSVNPAFPGVQIGQFSPLVGARPFRRPTHSGNLFVTYGRGPANAAIVATFVGKSDDSTFLSDAFFGSSLLLPNHDLVDGHQKVDLSLSYDLHPRARWHMSIENLLDQRYVASPGFLALPLTFRTGLTLTLGGEATATR